MHPRLRRLVLIGVLLTFVGLIGLAVTITAGGPVSPVWFTPFYVAGLLVLLAALAGWLLDLVSHREERGSQDHPSSHPDS